METNIKKIECQMSSRINYAKNRINTDGNLMIINYMHFDKSGFCDKCINHIVLVTDLQIEYLKHYKTLMKYHNMRGELKRDALFNSIIYDEKCTKMPHDCILNIFEYMKF